MLKQLYTIHGEQLTGTPWDVYPRPQMRRDSYFNLNGMWELKVEDECYQIQVPFCPESILSNVNRHFNEGTTLIYRRHFQLPKDFNQGKVLLHIGAADQICEVYLNQKYIGKHIGGYTAFHFDISDALKEDNLLEIHCIDDLNDHSMPYGKQTLTRGGMWYTPVSGIWQSVWLESVPNEYIESIKIENRGTSVHLSIQPALDGIVKIDGLGEYPLKAGKVIIQPEHPHLWSPEDPYLYHFQIITKEDVIQSYFAIRYIETKTFNGIPRLCLNGKPYFFHGVLDQGYVPDGIYTPASPQCYAEDIIAMKKLGFNTLRKHIKVEPEEFYYQCDKLGMIVFQDMVNNGDYNFLRDTAIPTIRIQKRNDIKMHTDSKTRERFLQSMKETIHQLYNHPCILYWNIFNEGWGQFNSDELYHQARSLDDTRIIDTTSGWFRRNQTDIESLHIYFGPWNQIHPYQKPLVLSEFGGYTYPVEGHLFNPDHAYGYKACKSQEEFQSQMIHLYQNKILASIEKGLCGAICTQISDVEDEINGFLTYDRKVCKANADAMSVLSNQLQAQLKQCCEPK